MPTVIDKLKIMGGPPPRNSNTSPLMATSKANRPLQSMLSLEKSYSLLLGGGRHSSDYGGVAATPATRRLECLHRVRQANFGISSMDSREEEEMEDTSPRFVLCGLSVGTNGPKPANTEHYLSEKRVGRYKTSAHEVYKARRNNKSMKPLCEPGPPTVDETGNGNDENAQSVPSLHTAPTPAFSWTSTSKKSTTTSCSKSSLELTGRNFRGTVSSTDEWDPYDIDDTTYSKTPKRFSRMTRREFTTDQMDSAREQQARELKDCLQVSRSKDALEKPKGTVACAKIFSKRDKNSNSNPYRNITQTERQALASNRRYEFTSVQSYINFNRTYHHHQNNKHFTLPKSILRVPNPCSDTFLLQMMFEMNKPRSKTFTNLYADNPPQREWDESVLTGRAATSHGKLAISAYRQVPVPLVRGVKTNMDEFLDYYYWSESDVKDDTDKESDRE